LPQLRDFLDRFRPAPVPGAASRLGVAADRARELSAELEPVLALLGPTHAECERIIAGARREAERIADQARQQVAATAAEGLRQSEAARAANADEIIAAARESASRAAADAAQRARSAPRASEMQINELVGAAVALVRALPDTRRNER
jgi:hypothetical protein